ncbi:MAG: two-component system response regulator, partial [Anaerolineae bacterium]|nr:two-component system response regulator [Anaerolineae bacterium]
GEEIPLGARIIRVARDFIGLQTHLLRESPLSPQDAYTTMKDRAGHLYDEEVILALQPMASGFSLEAHDDGSGTMLTIAELREGMELTRDLVSANGILLMVSGTILNESA